MDCKRGHLFTWANTYVRPNGTKTCRACLRTRSAEYRRKQKANA